MFASMTSSGFEFFFDDAWVVEARSRVCRKDTEANNFATRFNSLNDKSPYNYHHLLEDKKLTNTEGVRLRKRSSQTPILLDLTRICGRYAIRIA
jgi:hypothetical protein